MADQGRAIGGLSSLDGASQTLPLLYQLPASDFNDIVTGSNGLPAGVGYDLVTGRGSPHVNLVVDGLVGNGIVVGRTDVSLNASKNLVINDLSNAADHLTIQSDTTLNRFVISDPGKVLSDSTGLGTLLDSHTLAIPFSAVTGTSILVNSAGGADSLTLDFSKGNFSKQVNYDGGDPSTSPGDLLTIVRRERLSQMPFSQRAASTAVRSVSRETRPFRTSIRNRSIRC